MIEKCRIFTLTRVLLNVEVYAGDGIESAYQSPAVKDIKLPPQKKTPETTSEPLG